MQVVVVGAGYAGTLAANRLARKVPEARVTVVNPRPDFVERVRLHQQLAGTGTAATPLAEMLRDGVGSRTATVRKVGDRGLVLDTGEVMAFDYLVLAVGSTASPPPGTVPVATWEGAEQARAALAGLAPGGTVTVIGAGPTGIETAAEIAYGRPDLRVRLVGRDFAAGFSAGGRARARTGLERLKVEVTEGTVAEVAPDGDAGSAGTVRLESGERFASDLTLWGVVDAVPDLAARSGLEVDARGRAVVDEYLRSVTDPRILAVGDCAAVPGARAACQAAGPQGAHAADTLARLAGGRRLRPFSMGYVGTAISIGRRDAVLQVARRDDTPRRLYVAGRAAAAVKEGIVRSAKFGARTAYTAWLPGPE